MAKVLERQSRAGKERRRIRDIVTRPLGSWWRSLLQKAGSHPRRVQSPVNVSSWVSSLGCKFTRVCIFQCGVRRHCEVRCRIPFSVSRPNRGRLSAVGLRLWLYRFVPSTCLIFFDLTLIIITRLDRRRMRFILFPYNKKAGYHRKTRQSNSHTWQASGKLIIYRRE